MSRYKITSPKIAATRVDDSSITEELLNIPELGKLLGTRQDGSHDDFGTTVKTMLHERIGKPIGKWVAEPRSFFFKQYTKQETVKAVLLGFVAPLMTLLTGFGVISISLMLPNLLGFFALPATIELLAGIVSLGQAAWSKAWAVYYRANPEQSSAMNQDAEDYFNDFIVRFALVVPLAIVSFLSAPVDLIRFLTRSISTLIYGFRPEILAIETEIEKDLGGSDLEVDYEDGGEYTDRSPVGYYQ
ncbi:MAG: hypothetical protein H0U73_10535 [Tatlockia sp.]|nr:hypothetical protein [Tatlockia sp.]